jgi:SAM-dependent methyltransferase
VSWSDLTDWWLEELSGDPAYEEIVTPLLLEVLVPAPGRLYLDVGCGEGRVMRHLSALGSIVQGVDVNPDLARRAGGVVGDMLALPFGDGVYDGVYTILTLEHVEDHGTFFTESARVTRPGGVLALVMNHPVWTSPEATPIADIDGEVLWRPGEYFSRGVSVMAAGEETVSFHHRSMSDLLNAASDAGWSLQRMVEQPHHEFEDQAGIPRLLACRWHLG